MLEQMVAYLKGLPPELTTIIISALPVAELRGGIPVALAMGVSPVRALFLAVAGNLLPLVPLIFLLEPLSEILRRLPLLNRFFAWFFERTRKKARLVEKYEALGLMLFVAIPLPMTGMWSGAIAASLFKIPARYALPAIAAGVVIAGVIVSVLCVTGMIVYNGQTAFLK